MLPGAWAPIISPKPRTCHSLSSALSLASAPQHPLLCLVRFIGLCIGIALAILSVRSGKPDLTGLFSLQNVTPIHVSVHWALPASPKSGARARGHGRGQPGRASGLQEVPLAFCRHCGPVVSVLVHAAFAKSKA